MKRRIGCLAFACLMGCVAACSKTDDRPAENNPHPRVLTDVVVVKIPEALDRESLARQYGDSLNLFLTKEGIGGTVGRGKIRKGPDGAVEYAELRVRVVRPGKNLPLVKDKLKELGAPPVTTIERFVPLYRKSILGS